MNALHYVIESYDDLREDEDIVLKKSKILVKNGIDIFIKDYKGDSPRTNSVDYRRNYKKVYNYLDSFYEQDDD